jgi:hypothetical protein
MFGKEDFISKIEQGVLGLIKKTPDITIESLMEVMKLDKTNFFSICIINIVKDKKCLLRSPKISFVYKNSELMGKNFKSFSRPH